MSYDFHLVPQTTAEDPVEAARAWLERDEHEINPGPPVPEKEERKKRLARLLVESNPELEPFSFGFSEIAKTYNWTEDEARVRFRHVELNGPEDGNGIQITLYDDTADIAVPYWHQPEAAGAVFDEIWRYLTILVEEGGLMVYDPQLDRILDLTSDRDEVLKTYSGVVASMPDIAANATTRRTPWWKFW